MSNLYTTTSQAASTPILGVSLTQLQNRLDGLLLVLKTCKTDTCRDPWGALLPGEGVVSLSAALNAKYDDFFATKLPKVSFSRCEGGYLLDAEGPAFVPGQVGLRV